MKIDMDAFGLAAFVLTMVVAALLVPELSSETLGHPTFGAIVGGAVVLTVITVLRAKGRRGSRLERAGLAVFLFLMPTVYLVSLLRFDQGSAWLLVEVAGQLVFGAVAVLGFRGSPWFLAVGIGGHGLLWDSWHYGRTPFMPDWYAIACAVVDVGVAAYIVGQVRAWQHAEITIDK